MFDLIPEDLLGGVLKKKRGKCGLPTCIVFVSQMYCLSGEVGHVDVLTGGYRLVKNLQSGT